MMTPQRYVIQLQRSPVIIELGSLLTKVGFAGDASPTAIVPTRGMLAGGKMIPIFGMLKEAVRLEALTNFFMDLFTRFLLCNSKDRKVVVILNPFESQDLEMAVLSVLLNILEIPSVSFVAPHMTIFPSLGILHTGLIIDIGNLTRIIPVSHNTSLVGAWEVLPSVGYAGFVRWISKNLPSSCKVTNSRRYSIESGKSESSQSSESYTMEDICDKLDMDQFCQDLLDRYLVCTTSARGLKLAQEQPYGPLFAPFPDLKTQLRAGDISHDVVISGRFLEEAMEIFFRPDIDGQNLPYAVLDVLLKCPIDLRRSMMQNIMVVGGMADLRNFLPRLNAELKIAVQEPQYVQKLSNPEFMFVNCGKIPTNIVAWRGCSILSQANYYPDSASFTREDVMLHTSGNNVSNLLKEWCFVGKNRRMAR